MEKAVKRQVLLCKIEELEYKLNIYDDSYSDADEINFSKEDLEAQLDDLKTQLKEIEKV